MATAISFEHVSKVYRLGAIGGGTLQEDLERLWARMRGRPDPLLKVGHEHHSRQVGREFWALDNLTFDVKEGQVVGIIGRNGAGKSTLLKILSQVTAPTSGRVTVRGRIASLLEVGTGFHPDLTGRENTFLNGAILGMTKSDVRHKFDSIVAFAGIEPFIDTPVKRYSSGMYVRLAFAIAAHLDPEILVIDEVLAVGDQEFQRRCIGKMQAVSSEGRTVLFVSHNMPVIQKLCSEAVLLVDGRVGSMGPTSAVLDEYLAAQTSDVLFFGRTLNLCDAPRWGGSGEARFSEVTVYSPADRTVSGGFRGGDIGFRFRVSGGTGAVRAVGLQITDESDRKLVNANTLEQTDRLQIGADGMVELEILGLNLRPGRYKVGYWLGASETRHIDVITEATVLEVLPPVGATWVSSNEGVFYCPFRFRVSSVEGS